MGDWLVLIGASLLVLSNAVMFGDLMELRGAGGDAGEVQRKLGTGVAGNRWIKALVVLLVAAGMVLVTVGLVVGI